MKKVLFLLTFFFIASITNIDAQRAKKSSTKSYHSGTYKSGSSSSHKGGKYKNSSTNNHYRKRKK